MAREYIEREAALNASKIVYIEYIEVDGEGYEEGNADNIPVVFKKDIDAIPAADVRPVVRGRWVKSKMSAWGYRQWYECSECGEPVFPSYGHPARTNFCHNCGADMREVDDG